VDLSTRARTRKRSPSSSSRQPRQVCCASLRLQSHHSVRLQTHQQIHCPHQLFIYIVRKTRVLRHFSLLSSLSMSLLLLLLQLFSMAARLFQMLLSQVLQTLRTLLLSDSLQPQSLLFPPLQLPFQRRVFRRIALASLKIALLKIHVVTSKPG
jgi:hypothetical protein